MLCKKIYKNGVDYYDDSISTTVESTINGIESIPNASTVLIGGMDRGINYAALVTYLAQSKLTNVICMYKSGKRIYEMFKGLETINPKLTYCENLHEATVMLTLKTLKNEETPLNQ